MTWVWLALASIAVWSLVWLTLAAICCKEQLQELNKTLSSKFLYEVERDRERER